MVRVGRGRCCVCSVFLARCGLAAVGPQGAMPPAASPQAANPPSVDPDAGRGRQGGRGGRAGPTKRIPPTPKPTSRSGPVLPLSPDEQAKQFMLPAGYRLEPVLSDPAIKEPTAIAFDGNGRMFVLEDRGYMQDADAAGERDPVGRISVHEDVNNDGVYEKHTVFVDKLVFPRFVTPFGANSILTMETDADEVWKYTDTNGDGVADKKELFATGFGRVRQRRAPAGVPDLGDGQLALQHRQRVPRRAGRRHGVMREPTGSNGAQWGVTQDNDGKMWFQGGASGMPGYFQFPIVYGNFNVPDNSRQDFADSVGRAGPHRRHAGRDAVRAHARRHAQPRDRRGRQRRLSRRSAAGRSRSATTSTASRSARIVRRVQPVVTEGLTQLATSTAGTSSSGRPIRCSVRWTWRPRPTARSTSSTCTAASSRRRSGPAGARTCARRIDQYELDKVAQPRPDLAADVRRDARATRTQPRMLNETPAQLVAHLSHPNGWWRDTAQQLLVLKQDKSVVPALQQLVRTSHESAGPLPRAVDARGARRARCGARARADEGRRIRACASRRSAPARRSTRPATGRSPPTTARWRRIPTRTS